MPAPVLVFLHIAMFPNSSRVTDYPLLSHGDAQPFCHVRQPRNRSWLNSYPQLCTDTACSSSATSVQSRPMNLGRNPLLWKALGEICQVLSLKRAAAATVLFPGGSLLTHVGFWSHLCVTQQLPLASLLTAGSVAVTSPATMGLDMPWTDGDHSLVHPLRTAILVLYIQNELSGAIFNQSIQLPI